MPPTKRLLITIAGEASTGKSTAAALIADFLRANGVRYHVCDPEVDMAAIPHSKRDADEFMRAMAAKGIVVTIQTQQLGRQTSEQQSTA